MQKVFSHSSLSSFEKCPKQYHFRYIEKRPVEGESVEAFLGKRVHEVLERLHLFAGEARLPSLRRVQERYLANWEAQFQPERTRIVHADLGVEWYRDAGCRALENYYRRFYPFDQDQTLALEKRVEFALDESGEYRMRGIIDRIARAPDGVLEIQDYKTGRRVPRQEQIDKDRQLALYEIGLRAAGESGPIRLVWHYVLTDKTRISTRTPEQLEALRDKTRGWIDRVRSEQEWAPRTSPLCSWCEYRSGCPAFAETEAAEARAAEGPPPEDPPVSPAVLDADGQWRML